MESKQSYRVGYLSGHHDAIIKERKRLREVLESKHAICTCGCNFGDACLCREEKEGFNKLKREILLEVREEE